MTIQEAQQQLLYQLRNLYDEREAAAITDLVMEHLTGKKKIQRIIAKAEPLSFAQKELLNACSNELLTHKPVQYVLHEAWFCGISFYVNEKVLIPRPETEELVNWVVEDAVKEFIRAGAGAAQAPDRPPLILDIGSGSGCIPVAIKKKLPSATVLSCDISEDALVIARANATRHEAVIEFRHLDFLNPKEWVRLPPVDVIVSNPPYIPFTEKETVPKNVADFEPALALFVEDSDPIVFYRAITSFAKEKLLRGGNVFVEMHEQYAVAVSDLFSSEGFEHIEIKNDLQGKVRMLKATSLL